MRIDLGGKTCNQNLISICDQLIIYRLILVEWNCQKCDCYIAYNFELKMLKYEESAQNYRLFMNFQMEKFLRSKIQDSDALNQCLTLNFLISNTWVLMSLEFMSLQRVQLRNAIQI
ncbi:unnamed protein product [Paramecium sonneborni]|uniref:Uncharacterized protein n=1 Tax=Paramecium sonneborni TaxID=65129 RepID=A0A8S1R0N2_9CILI|nr:unnamed protein product [Paramecium sonneborni]